jgi:hypothetical protein
MSIPSKSVPAKSVPKLRAMLHELKTEREEVRNPIFFWSSSFSNITLTLCFQLTRSNSAAAQRVLKASAEATRLESEITGVFKALDEVIDRPTCCRFKAHLLFAFQANEGLASVDGEHPRRLMDELSRRLPGDSL